MLFAITYNVYGVPFRYETENVYDLFNAVTAVIRANKLMYPDQDQMMNEYFTICADIAKGKIINHENHIFKVERLGK